MKIEQIYTGCLAEAAYYIESEGEAAIIDPLRESAPYLEKAKQRGATIKYIFETHFHADFVSGHVDLAQKTGAQIVFGPQADTEYASYQAQDGELLTLGKLRIRVLHTPGHTPESTCYLLLDEEEQAQAIFTGDTLFIGDVGRPDLAIRSDLSKEDLAGMLYDSLRSKIMPLPDSVTVYPAHGAGSACGKNMSKETYSSLGHQKVTNYALRADMKKEEFIQEVLEGILPPPQYFAKNALMNKQGYADFDTVLSKGKRPLSVAALEAAADSGALVLDVRPAADFVQGHIPNSIFIGLDGSFAPWVGALIKDLHQAIVLVAPKEREEEAITRLSRVGYDHTIGFLEGGFAAWSSAGKATEELRSITAMALEEIQRQDGNIRILDARKPGEFARQHLSGATNLPLDFINERMDDIHADATYYIHCAGGYRSVIMASILQSRGFKHLVDVQGGFNAIKGTQIALSEASCTGTS